MRTSSSGSASRSTSRLVLLLLTVAAAAAAVHAQQPPIPPCEQCPVWNAPQPPVRIFGNVYYVGPRGLSAILITSDDGHVLLDGALPESVPGIVAGIRALGFRIEDVKLILNSHAHFDHAGGVGALQRLTGARVAALRPSAQVFERGQSGPDDPQYGILPPLAVVKNVQVVQPRETLRVGPLALTAHATGGHTPGGTTWTWRSCMDGRCLDLVYADSISAVSADSFLFTRSKDYPGAVRDFERAFDTLKTLPCDVLITPHPEASDLWGRVARRDAGGGVDALVDRDACRRYAEAGRARLETRLQREKAQ